MNYFLEKIGSLIKPFAEVRPEERFKTWVMFFYFFLTISLIYILKPVRGALFLGELGAQNLRYVYMGEGVFLIFVAAAYVYLSKKLPKKIFFASTLFFFASNLVLFWFLFHFKTPYLSAYFYIWVASFSITSTTQFWILANDIFNPQEAKRLFGLIISGGSAGGILGGIATAQLTRFLRAEDMLLVAAGVVVFCAALVLFFWRTIVPKEASAAVQEKPKDDGSGKKLLMGSSYLIMLALLVMLAKMSSTIIDNQFNRFVELHVIGKEARTAFFAGFMAWLNAVSFIMQLFLTGLSLRFLGVGLSLWILPVGLTLFCFGSIAYPVLAVGLLLKAFDGSVNYSIQQASKEVLFLPVPSKVRYRVKPVIDMLGFRVAKSLSGVYIALAAPLFMLPDEKLGVLVLFLIPVWLVLIWKMRGAYSDMLRQHVVLHPAPKKQAKTLDILSIFSEGQSLQNVQGMIENESAYVRKIAAARLLVENLAMKEKNGQWQAWENKIKTEWDGHKTLPRPAGRAQIKKTLLKEVRLRRDVLKLYWFHQTRDTDTGKYLKALTLAFLDENLERVFELLELLYPKESIAQIHQSLLSKDTLTRTHALELLMNALEPDLLVVLPGVLDPKPVNSTHKEIREVLERLTLSSDWWSVVMAFFAERHYTELAGEKPLSEDRLFA